MRKNVMSWITMSIIGIKLTSTPSLELALPWDIGSSSKTKEQEKSANRKMTDRKIGMSELPHFPVCHFPVDCFPVSRFVIHTLRSSLLDNCRTRAAAAVRAHYGAEPLH